MSLSSFFQRFRRVTSSGQVSAADAVSAVPSDVEAARVRARRRLIGMAVLVGAGIIGFPWLFETQPRSMSQDVQVVQAPTASGGSNPASSGSPGVSGRSATGRVAVAGIVPAPSVPQEAPVVKDEPVAKPAPVQDEPASAEPAPKPEQKPEPKAEPKPEPRHDPKAALIKPVDKTASKPVAKSPVKETPKEVAKASAKDAPKSASKPADKTPDKAATRYVVQFGAFADANAAHEARMKVERLGAKTYAQQVDTPGGKRIRVRLGPFSDKAEADKAMATVKKAGLTGALLTL